MFSKKMSKIDLDNDCDYDCIDFDNDENWVNSNTIKNKIPVLSLNFVFFYTFYSF